MSVDSLRETPSRIFCNWSIWPWACWDRGKWKRLCRGVWVIPSAKIICLFFVKENNSGNLCMRISFPHGSSHKKQDLQLLVSTLSIPLNLSKSFNISLYQKEPFFEVPGNLPETQGMSSLLKILWRCLISSASFWVRLTKCCQAVPTGTCDTVLYISLATGIVVISHGPSSTLK